MMLEQAGLGKQNRDGMDPEMEEALNLWHSAVLTNGAENNSRCSQALHTGFAVVLCRVRLQRCTSRTALDVC